MTDLDASVLPQLAKRGVGIPTFDRASTQIGVVHFGPGAFHRVHQAWYFNRALESDPRWAICEVALQTPGVRDALEPQDGLYTLAILDERRVLQVMGCIKELLVARESPHAVIARLADPHTHIVTATVTEKGYCLRGDGSLDVTHPDIAHDLAHPQSPRSLIGYVVAGLRVRRERRLAPLTIISCDNLTNNGRRFKRGVLEFCAQLDPSAVAWIDAEVAFPSTMVDSITPATDDALRDFVAGELGVRDRWPVQREAFTQWVIEDDLRGTQPDWTGMGATITDDVHGFERAKLRLLNGAHSTLAYVGSLVGYETVRDAMNDATLASFIERMMIEDIAPTLSAPRGLDVTHYIADVLRRFRNPAIRHLLAQIAWDGSQKLPFRLLGTINDRLNDQRSVERLAVPIAAWMEFVCRKALRGERLTDPLASELLAIGAVRTGTRADVKPYLALEQMFAPTLQSNDAFVRALEAAYVKLQGVSTPTDLAAALSSDG